MCGKHYVQFTRGSFVMLSILQKTKPTALNILVYLDMQERRKSGDLCGHGNNNKLLITFVKEKEFGCV